MTDLPVFPAALGTTARETRDSRRPARGFFIAMLRRAVQAMAAAAAFHGAGAPVQAFPGLDRPKVTIAAERGSYGFGIDDVVFRLRRAGPADEALSVRVSLAQAQLYLPADRLDAVVRFWPDEREAEFRIRAREFNGPATESGVLAATLVHAFSYTVGRPNTARTRMVVNDPAITVRPEQASYSVNESDGAVRVTFVARTAPDLPRPAKAFSIAVSSKAGGDDAVARARTRAVSRTIDFRPRDFAGEDGEWQARKTVSIAMPEADEGLEVMFQRAASTPERIRPRNADGTPCANDVCMVPVTMAQRDGPTLTIAAGSDTYGYQIDDVVFTVTRTGPAEEEVGGSVTIAQEDTYLPAGSLSWTFTIPANETTASHTFSRSEFSGGASQTGDLTATLDDGDGYEVGTPGAATVSMVVADPAITVRPEHAAYSFDEGDDAASVTFIARTAPGLPRPGTAFSVTVSAKARSDGAGSPDDYAALSETIAFEPDDFTASGSEWEARKEIALTLVDDGEDEGDETFDLELEMTPGLPNRIGLRQADGSACPDEGCLTPVTISDPSEDPVLTIAAGRDTYGYQIDDVVFTVTRTGPAEEEIGGSVTIAQEHTYLPAASLSWTFTIPANETAASHTLSRSDFSGGATQTGDLTATLDDGDGYAVGTPGAATVSMVVADPAITVRPEHAAYSFDEDDDAASVTFIARTAPDVPRPGTAFSVTVSAKARSDGAGSPDDYAALSETIAFATDDFTASGSEWEARKEIALTLVDDGEDEGDETFDLELEGTTELPNRIGLRQADGSACPDQGCLTPVTIRDNDGLAANGLAITPVPPAASADHGPYYTKKDFLALPDDTVHGRGATLTFTLTLTDEVIVTGSPELVLDIFDRERRARYTGGSGTRRLTFVWTVQKGDNDPNGLEVRSLDLKGGTIRDREGRDLLPQTIPPHHFAEHRVRGGLFAMRLEAAGSAREGEPFEIRVIRNGGYDEVAVAMVGVADSFLSLIESSHHYAVNGPGRRQFDFDDGEPSEPGVRVSTRTMTPPGDGIADASRTMTVRLTGTDAGFQSTPPLGDYRAWYLTEGPLEVTVPVIDTGQPLAMAGLRVHGASAREAPGAKLVFRVTLSPRSEAPVTVDYRTGDDPHNEPKAVADEDYVAIDGKLTFEPGEQEKTVEVEVLPDDHDEGLETMRLFLSNAVGARIDTASGLGVIKNDGPIPRAWIARFGRTVADQVLGAVESRMRAARKPGAEVTLAGQRVGGRAPKDDADAAAGSAWPDPVGFGSPESRGATAHDLLGGTSFTVTGEAGRGGYMSLWGRGAVTRFDGREDELTLDGEVASAMVGVDWVRGSWTAGLIASRSDAEGGYAGHGKGRAEATATGLWPWGRLALTDSVEAWGAAGYGTGELSVTPATPGTKEDGATARTDLDLRMAAAGLRGVLVDGGSDGLSLTGKTDATIVGTSSDEARGSDGGGLARASARVTRLRLGLEGERPIRLDDGGTLTPFAEIGMRRDGGDAETGFGVDLGGGIAWTLPAHGLRIELRGRGLLTHEAEGFRERGFSGALSWDPVPSSARGPALTLTRSADGPASGGADAVLAPAALPRIGAKPQRRLEARLGYGFAAWSGRFVSVPEIGLGLGETGREYRLGWRLAGEGLPGPGALALSAEIRRSEPAGGNPAQHRVGARLSARW